MKKKILEFIQNPLKLGHKCHSQNYERNVKLVTKAFAYDLGHDNRDEVIRNKVRSSKLNNDFDSKREFKFNVWFW